MLICTIPVFHELVLHLAYILHLVHPDLKVKRIICVLPYDQGIILPSFLGLLMRILRDLLN